MATIKLKFRPSSVHGSAGSLYYQLIHRRNIRCIYSGYHIFPDEWDSKAKTLVIPDGKRKAELLFIRSSVYGKLNLYKNIILRMESGNKSFSIEELCTTLRSFSRDETLFQYFQGLVEKRMHMQMHGTAKNYANAYHRFREFRNGKDLAFEELTPDMVECYGVWLSLRGLKENSIRFYLRTLHTLLRKAESDGHPVMKELFRHVRLSYVRTAKRAISESSLQAIEQLRLPHGSSIAFARDMFMFSFYMRGMSFVDIAFLKKSDLKYGVLCYCRKKTNQALEVEWENELQEIVNRYANLAHHTPYMFPIILNEDGTEYQQYRLMLEKVNRNLKKVGEMVGLKIPLTTYVARHSWATIARDMDFPLAVISEGMGHNSYRTTQIYLDSINLSKVNEANRKIIKRVHWKR